MPSTPNMHMSTGFSGRVSRAAAGDDKYRVSKRTQGYGIQDATNNNHHDRRAGHNGSYRPHNQTNATQSKSFVERVRFNGASCIQNSIKNFSGTKTEATTPSPNTDDKKSTTNKPEDKLESKPPNLSKPYGRGFFPKPFPSTKAGQHPNPPQHGRKFGDLLENLQTDPSLCQRRGDRKYLKSAFTFGTVFSTAHHTPAGGPDDPEHMTTTRHYGRVYSKYRKFIVVECNEVSFVALPIYTCNGTGLSRKSSREIPEYIDVMDRRVEVPGPANGVNGRLFCVADGESEDAPVLRDNKDYTRVGAKGNACVRLTEPCSFRYSIWSRIEAQLTDDSVHLLREVRATKMAASSFKVLQEMSPANLVCLLGKMVQADFVEKLAQMQAESLVKMRGRKQIEAVDAEKDEGEPVGS
ncbi:uncharacterized protein PgNI_08696 [Pyricularia grisea]|uniref:DUF6590 domain-containing protein n=1 Tax=Pyricularia grisea TaxID=148305 RepID=A0A6P8AW87_PYRGI|nr:uncharacterized protein PgNI_08696 [Pyricularia grisea]TLD06457.1 hypothetical protein PgNI_08696 [Pyricularia grisea]